MANDGYTEDSARMHYKHDNLMNGHRSSYDAVYSKRHSLEGYKDPSSNYLPQAPQGQANGDHVDNGDKVSVSGLSDQSQKSFGERHREALTEMFERKIQRLRKDDMTYQPVSMETSQRNERKVQHDRHDRGMNGHYSEDINHSWEDGSSRLESRSRETNKAGHHLSRYSASYDSLSNNISTGIASTYNSGCTDQLHNNSDHQTQKFQRSHSPYRVNASHQNIASNTRQASRERIANYTYNSNSGGKYPPISDPNTRPEPNYSSIKNYRSSEINKHGYRLDNSADSLKVPRPDRYHSEMNHANYPEHDRNTKSRSPNKTEQQDGLPRRTEPDRNVGLSKRIPGEGSSGTDNQKNNSALNMEDIYRMQDMEDTILSLRRLLNDREKEIDELKMLQQDLQSQLNQQRTSVHTATNEETYKNEKRVKELIMEKECLTTELQRMREEMDRLKKGAATWPPEGDKAVSHIDNYQPNNPLALQRKIQDLEGQIEDLTEVNESALARYDLLEEQHKKQMEEKQNPSSPSINLLQQQNKELQQQVMELRKLRSVMGKTSTMGDLDYMQSEVGNLRKDLRTLRDKNHQLMQDNIHLTEYIRDLEIARSPAIDDITEQNDSVVEKFHHERDASLREIAFHKEKFQKSQYKPKEQIPSEQKYSSNPYSTQTRSDRTDSFLEYPEGGMVDYQMSHTHYSNVNGGLASDHSDMSPHGRPEMEDDLIDDVLDELPMPSSKPQFPLSQGLYQVYPNKQELNGEPRGIPSLDDLHTDGHYGSLAYTHSNREELSNLDSRTPRRRDSLNSNSTEFLMNELSHHLQLQAFHSRDAEVSEFIQDLAGVGDTTIDLANKTVDIGPFELVDNRPVNSAAIATQQTKHNLEASQIRKDLTPLIQGKVPFAPRNPTDINIGDVVKFCRQGGKISRGLVKYVGHLPAKNDVYLGIELEHEIGKHDGTYEGQRYFQCKSNRGVFVAFSKVVMVWGAT